MRNNVTTSTRGFRMEDVTFHNARKQSEILNEGVADNFDDEEDNVSTPPSLTPEQVKNFYSECIKNTHDTGKKRVYHQTIMWINELLDLKKKEMLKIIKDFNKEDNETVDDIQSDTQESADNE